MTRDQKIRKVGGEFLMWLEISQVIFILGIILSPFVLIFATKILSLKVFIASIVGFIMIWVIYSGIYKVIGDSIDELEDRKSRLWGN